MLGSTRLSGNSGSPTEGWKPAAAAAAVTAARGARQLELGGRGQDLPARSDHSSVMGASSLSFTRAGCQPAAAAEAPLHAAMP